jgi:iron complex outermembrane receptor protein
MTRKIALRSGLAASAAFTVFGFATAAHAQPDAAQPASSAPVAAPADGEPVILVTAQRREQTLAEVPQSMAVVGGETLERQQATSFLDYVQLVPGLNITQENPGESRVVIRGINTNSVGSTVSIYVDDTPFGSSGSLSNGGVLAGDFDTFDVARIEVLRGPQGTLYGSNALGGTLKFVTALPDTHRFEARARAGVEFVDDGGTGWMGNAMANVPLGDTLAFRASGFYRRNAGWIDAVGRSGTNINEADSYGGRASLLYRPSDNFSVRLLALAQNINSNSPSTFDADPVTFRPVNAITGLPSEEKTRFERFPEYNDIAYRLYSGTVNWDFNFASLTSSTSYSTLDQNNFSDISNTGNRGTANVLFAPTAPGTIGLAFQADITTHKFTQEVRLASPDSESFEWLIGGYYTHETSGLLQRFRPFTLATQALLPTAFTFGGTNFTDFVRVTLDSDYEELAAFASATWHLSDRFDITAGGRYSHNSQTSTQVSAILTPPATINGESSESVFTWSVAPRFELSDHASIYARVAKGYRPGGPNAVPPGAPANFLSSFEADTLVSYEAGVRAETPDRTFAIDA